MYNELNFTYDWNNKLQCKAFTTLRLWNPVKYQIDRKFNVSLKGRFLFIAQVISIKKIFIPDINEFIAHIDTGYTAAECRKMLAKMYDSKTLIDSGLAFILLKKVEE